MATPKSTSKGTKPTPSASTRWYLDRGNERIWNNEPQGAKQQEGGDPGQQALALRFHPVSIHVSWAVDRQWLSPFRIILPYESLSPGGTVQYSTVQM